MKNFISLVVICSFGYSFVFVNPYAVRYSFCDNECNIITSNKARKEGKNFNREYFNKCVNACVKYQDYYNLK